MGKICSLPKPGSKLFQSKLVQVGFNALAFKRISDPPDFLFMDSSKKEKVSMLHAHQHAVIEESFPCAQQCPPCCTPVLDATSSRSPVT